MTDTIKKKLDVDGVIFDLGSTLVEYETIPWSKLDHICAESGLVYLQQNGYKPPPHDTFMEKVFEVWYRHREETGRTLIEWNLIDALAEVLDYFKIGAKDNTTDSFFAAFYAPVRKQLSIFADTITVLNEIKNQGKNIGLISNTIFPEEYHRRELDSFGLTKYFEFMIFSVTFGYRKPHRSIFDEAAKLSGIAPGKLLYIGDRYVEDVQGPRDCGWNSILKYHKNRDYPEPLPKDTIVVYSLAEMLDYI